jgi:hypothetical protein
MMVEDVGHQNFQASAQEEELKAHSGIPAK